jgi:hypothetical protein
VTPRVKNVILGVLVDVRCSPDTDRNSGLSEGRDVPDAGIPGFNRSTRSLGRQYQQGV